MIIFIESNEIFMKKKAKKYPEVNPDHLSEFRDYQGDEGYTSTFIVKKGGEKLNYTVKPVFGYFIKSLQKARNLQEVGVMLEENFTYQEVSPLIEFLNLKASEIAKATSVSPSTVSRWSVDSSIGTPGSYQFFKIDELIKNGVELFGSEIQFKKWLYSSNLALGNAIPAQLMLSMYGLEMVSETVEALHFGNVM
ncbi:putative toxin-antitoxin system antitoxin component (TIGR02293 family) [Mongoliibacter ruber]|uniref:Putative toxin-antitoxin system antitoxin component (TIGR02293 family) n=2 Tax=Mongoliibacter ruber TaxID=1750599 RepID=A0A2T0WV69_9BACT|nr:putative toxin-antitoxin system antitoxin component (TIGR02293 family) [Mongoliibacter ruber]